MLGTGKIFFFIVLALSACAFAASCPPGDIVADCKIDFKDLSLLAEYWLNNAPPFDNLAGQPQINLEDFTVLAANWQKQSAALVINEFMASNNSTIQDPQEPGEYPDWIELYNFGETEIQLGGMYLTDDLMQKTKWLIPQGITIGPNSYILFLADDDDEQGLVHTNFKLSASGESLAIVDPDGSTIIDSIVFDAQIEDYSYGRTTDASNDWIAFSTTTPQISNSFGTQAQVADTKFSANRGFYDQPFQVFITTQTPNAQIYYTIDGSEPSQQSTLYTNPITISTTTCLRAAAFKQSYTPTNIDTQTYIFINDVISQTAPAGYPSMWTYSLSADYEMDPEVVTDPNYSPLIADAMLALPTLSIVTDIENLFNPSSDPNIGGIYMNTIEHGVEWERPTSVEFFDNSDPDQFQVDCGLRIHGGTNRLPNVSPKHSFRLLFKEEYGPTKLNFPLYGDNAADEFDSLILRGGSNMSWLHFDDWQRRKSQYIRDQWTRDMQLAMSSASAHDRYVHLYLNGIYWGIYSFTERPDGQFMSSYFGGEKEDYDVLHSSEVVCGDKNAWDQMMQIARSDIADYANYQQIQQYLDMENFADYAILNTYIGNYDWHYNWYAGRKRAPNETYKFFAWDSEMTLVSLGSNVIDEAANDRPTELFQKLRQNDEFRMYFADRVHANFFNDGPFYVDPDNPDWNPDLPGQNRPADLWMNRAGKIELAVIAESARWGDYRRDVHQYYEQGPFELYTRNDHWFTEQNNLLTNYFPNRTQTVLRHYRDADLYPGIDAPVFDRQAGQIPPGSLLTMQADVPGTIYYTTDGTDPRLPNTRQRATTVLVAEDAEKFIRIPDSIEDSRSQPLFEIMSIKANIPLTNLSIASQVILSPDYQQSTITETCNVINFLGEGPNGHFLEDNAFPHGSTGSAPDDFVFYAIGKVDIPAPGPWTFGVNSDDGFFLVVGPLLAFHQDIRQPADTLTVYDFPQSGEQVVYMRFFQHTDGAHVELFAAQGTFTEFDPQQFRLVGDTQNGGLPLTSRTFWYQLDFDHTNWNEYTTIATTSGAVGFSQDNSFDQYVTYDLVDSMQNKSSSCYIRIPFTVEAYDLEFIDELKLNVRYDDGFVAYLNGTEIARASAPAQLDFDSAATLERPNEQALTIESFDVLQFKDKFQNGQNILAIQGLNINDTDDDFLISAELLAGSLGPCQISSTAIEYTAPITIDADTQINARLLSQREWSALNNTAFTTAP